MRIASLLLASLVLVAAAADDWADVRYRAGFAEIGKKHEEAETLWRQAVDLAGEDDVRRRVSLAGLGRTLLAAGRAADAVEPLKAAGRLYRADDAAPAFERLRNLVRFGEALRETRDLKTAAVVYREALTLVGEVEGEGTALEADLLLGLGYCGAPFVPNDEAIRSLTRALAIYDGRPRSDPEKVRRCLDVLSRLHQARKEWKAALPCARRYLELTEAHEKPASEAVLLARLGFARTLGECGKPREAERLYRTLVSGPKRGEAWVGIGRVRLAQGRLDEAEMYVRKGLEGDQGWLLATEGSLLADIVEKRGRKAEAEEIRKKVSAMWRQEG